MEQKVKNKAYTIFAIGFAKWRGCDPRALAQSFLKQGHYLIELDAEDYISWRWESVYLKIIRKIFLKLLIKDYNDQIKKTAVRSNFDFVLIFKGLYILPETISYLKQFNKPIYNIYPDLSFEDHGNDIPGSLKNYDCVFTTKSFHGEKEKNKFQIKNFEYIRHGFDPEVHRPITLNQDMLDKYSSDISFVGCWSEEKEKILLEIKKRLMDKKIIVHGIGWNRASNDFQNLFNKDIKRPVFGDELTIVYNASKINLGLLSNSPSDPAYKDLTTVRSFQIPASKSFMIHEDNAEIRSYFEDGKEIVLFSSIDDLINKIEYYLDNENLRNEISYNGHLKSYAVPYDYSYAAKRIIDYYQSKLNL